VDDTAQVPSDPPPSRQRWGHAAALLRPRLRRWGMLAAMLLLVLGIVMVFSLFVGLAVASGSPTTPGLGVFSNVTVVP